MSESGSRTSENDQRVIEDVRELRASGDVRPLRELISDTVLSDEQLLNLACIDLITLLRLGHEIQVENYVDMFPSLGQDGFLMDLIDAEICTRRELAAPLAKTDYLCRFPHLASSIENLFAFDASGQPDKLGGYRLLETLGQGAIGHVYKARQISLDRIVAVKVIRAKWAGNARVMSRFVREAYAAAKLSHPNVVRIYDFGVDRGQYYFSMEWVRSGSLAKQIAVTGPLDPPTAARHILQAARGLHYAHGHGMVHRDIKPANLLLDGEDVVKVADLGLVKIPGTAEDIEPAPTLIQSLSATEVTGYGSALGTPKYMAPEQAIDAQAVDHRADIYSLGMTLQSILQPHAKPPAGSERTPIPSALATIIARATARLPEDRYPSLEEMILDLESFLGLDARAKDQLDPDAASEAQALAEQWHALGRTRMPTYLTLAAACLALGITFLIVDSLPGLRRSLGIGSGFFAAILGFAVIADAMGQSQLVPATRKVLTRLPLQRWGHLGLAALLLTMMVAWLDGVGHVLLGGLAGCILGGLASYVWCRRHADASQAIMRESESWLRRLRHQGLGEWQIQRLFVQHAGSHWAGLFVELFGYQALESRAHAADRTLRLGWRDRMARWLHAYARQLKSQKDHRKLVALESQSLASQGVSPSVATRQAWQVATALLQASQEIERSQGPQRQADQARRARMKAMLADARNEPTPQLSPGKSLLTPLFDQFARLVLGGVLLAVVGGSDRSLQLREAIEQTYASEQGFSSEQLAKLFELATLSFQLGTWTTSWLCVAVAGLILFGSSFFQGARMSLFVLPAACLLLFGPHFHVSIEYCLAGAATLSAMGVLLGRTKRRVDMF